jgi:hypothetical protein
MRGRVDRVAAAHAIADGADELRVRSLLRLGIGEERPGVVHHHRNVDGVHVAEHPLALGRLGIGRDRPQLHDARAVIQIGQHHVIARCAEPPRHVAQLLADRRRVHVKDDDREGAAALGVGDERRGLAVLGRNVDLLVDHGRFLLSVIPMSGWVLDTITRKDRYDKAKGRYDLGERALERFSRDCHCLVVTINWRAERSR